MPSSSNLLFYLKTGFRITAINKHFKNTLIPPKTMGNKDTISNPLVKKFFFTLTITLKSKHVFLEKYPY